MTQATHFHSGLMWFRRDLRADDNAALYHALRRCAKVYCVFVFDSDILDSLPRADRRVEFILASLAGLDADLRRLAPDAGLIVLHGHPGQPLNARQAIPQLAHQLGVEQVFANHDDDPAALARDTAVRGALAAVGVGLHTCKDHLVFEREELLTQGGTPYTVFTPYRNAWLKKVDDYYLKDYPVERYVTALAPVPAHKALPTLADLGFEASNLAQLRIPTGSAGARSLFADFFERIDQYRQARDYPAIKGPSYLSTHLRFGTVSVRKLAATAHQLGITGSDGARCWLDELIWREFYHQILFHFPHVVGHSFKPAYDAIRWAHGKLADQHFEAWCQGRTGYPLVDAAMAQLNQTGYMHNRLRMVTASFLVKDLGLDWRRGEHYFALHLNDYDLAANNGGWQWASSSGCDAQPYFRIFNPITQSERFDPQGKFIRRYLPQLAALPDAAIHAPWLARPVDLQAAGLQLGRDYPLPLVQHDAARALTLERYAVVKTAAAPPPARAH